MLNRRLDENGDYVFGSNKYDFLTGKEAIAQAVKTKIMLFYQEWWEDISIGIPMFQSIIGKRYDKNLDMTIILLLTNRIMELNEVISVDDIQIMNNARGITVTVLLTTTDGQTSVEVNL